MRTGCPHCSVYCSAKCCKVARRMCPIVLQSPMQSPEATELEESKDNGGDNAYAAHVVRHGLDKEDWKLVVTGAAMIVMNQVHVVVASGFYQP